MNKFVLLLLFLVSCGSAQEDQKKIGFAKCPSSLALPDGYQFSAVVIHGLNMRPNKLQELEDLLRQMRVYPLRVELTGHHQNMRKKQISRHVWLNDFHKKYCQLPAQKIVVGYSLGALVALDYIEQTQNFPLAAVMFAPALDLKWYTSLVKVFNIFGNDFALPSLSNHEYKANDRTTIQSYNALFDHKEALVGPNLKKHNYKSLIFIDKEDELVSARGIKQIKKKYGLYNWALHYVNNRESKFDGKFHHLIIDSNSLGKKEWARVGTAIQEFLRKVEP